MRQLLDELRQSLAEVSDQAGVIQVGLWRARQSKKVRQLLQRFAPEATLLEPRFDLCITGVTQLPDGDGRIVSRVVYDIDKLVQMYIEKQMSVEEAMQTIAQQQCASDKNSGPIFVLALSMR
jgi:hypothetical protein